MRGLLEDASFNQSPPPFSCCNLFANDGPLTDAAARFGLDAAKLHACGVTYGSDNTLDLGRLADENPPRLRITDTKGFRVERVEFHPAHQQLMSTSIGFGIDSSVHEGSHGEKSMTTRAARLYRAAQAERGHPCPITNDGRERRRDHGASTLTDGALIA